MALISFSVSIYQDLEYPLSNFETIIFFKHETQGKISVAASIRMNKRKYFQNKENMEQKANENHKVLL